MPPGYAPVIVVSIFTVPISSVSAEQKKMGTKCEWENITPRLKKSLSLAGHGFLRPHLPKIKVPGNELECTCVLPYFSVGFWNQVSIIF